MMATSADSPLHNQLMEDLYHRFRPMPGHDPAERGRGSIPIELFYDLIYVIAFGFAAGELAHFLAEGAGWSAVGAYIFAVWAVSWAWMNFNWFASAYSNDDALFRVATFVQMIGVLVLTFGLPVSFLAAAHGQSPNNMLMVIGYAIMRVPLIALWIRASRQDPARRQTAIAYSIVIGVAQVGWLLTAILPLLPGVGITALIVLAAAEMIAPVVIERKFGLTPWNAGHIAERFGLLTIITLGEVVAATTMAVAALTQVQGWTLSAVVIAASGIILASALWWAYSLVPSRTILEEWPERTFAWRYAHLLLFGAISAVGAGLHVAALAVEDGHLTLLLVAVALVVPVAAVIIMIFVTWSVLLRSFDLTHLPLLILTLIPLAAAIVVGVVANSDHINPDEPSDVVSLVTVIGLVALSAVIEVVGHEMVGSKHTIRAVKAQAAA
jgi:low temperature requirement protein LtrA